jgi:gamma-glutamylcyclotransferase (GGCT)/AIG2-like uncharacterized protein YtfP
MRRRANGVDEVDDAVGGAREKSLILGLRRRSMLGLRAILPLFTYGTLLEREFTSRLLEHPVVTEPARLLGYETAELADLLYPVVVESEGGSVEGHLYRDLTSEDYERLDAYEGVREELYRRVAVEVVAGSESESRQPEPAYLYVATERTLRRYF